MVTRGAFNDKSAGSAESGDDLHTAAILEPVSSRERPMTGLNLPAAFLEVKMSPHAAYKYLIISAISPGRRVVYFSSCISRRMRSYNSVSCSLNARITLDNNAERRARDPR